MLFSVLTRKGSLKPQLSPSNIPVLVKRNQISVGSSFRATSHILSSYHAWQIQAPYPTGPLSPQTVQMGRSVLTDWDPERWPLLVRCRDRDGGEIHCSSRPGLRLAEDLSEGSGALQVVVYNLFPGPSSSPTGPRLGDLQPLQKSAWIWLFSHSPSDDHHTTLDLITSPMVPHWQ